MPMYKEWRHGRNTRVAIWKVTETEDFFTRGNDLQTDKKLALRRLEHLAGRYLLQQLVPGLQPDHIAISHLGKPYMHDGSLHFSISHSFPYIGVAVDHKQEIGIDVQTLQDKILRLQYKFLSESEQQFCGNQPDKVTLAWAAMEAAFKRYGLGAVDFIRHMPIRDMTVTEQEARMKMEFLREEPAVMLDLYGGIEPEFAWTVTL